MMAATKLIIFLFSFCFVLDGGIGRKDSLCDPTIICNKTRDYDIQKPFCGSDGSTYTSICELKTIICKGINVIKLFDGSCQTNSICIKEMFKRKDYNKNLHLINHESAPYLPKCNVTDGSYDLIQCHTNPGYCWCVKKSGKIIPNTATKEDKPSCRRRRRKVIHVSKNKYFKGNRRTSIHMNDCATFFQEGTIQNDLFIKLDDHKNTVKTGIMSSDEATDCRYQRNLTLTTTALDRLPFVYIPICQKRNDFLYEEVQCHPNSKVCWCVDMIKGEPVLGTSVTDKLPNCTIKRVSTLRVRDIVSKSKIADCQPKKQIKFYKLLFKKFIKQMSLDPSMAHLKSQIYTNFDRNTRLNLIKWKFEELDLNSNGVLEQKEYKLFRREIRKWNLFKRCAKNFVSFCDSNGDLKISTKEWEFCTLEASLNISLISIETQSHANPFLHILIPD